MTPDERDRLEVLTQGYIVGYDHRADVRAALAEIDSLKAQLEEDAKDAHSTGYSDGYRFGLEDAAKVADGYGVDGTRGFDTHRTTADAIAIDIRALAEKGKP